MKISLDAGRRGGGRGMGVSGVCEKQVGKGTPSKELFFKVDPGFVEPDTFEGSSLRKRI